MKYDAISIGDSTVDYFFQIHDAHIHANIDHISQEICLNYGSKVAVDELTRIPLAGNAANFAVGASRLGMQTALYTNIGDDVYGDAIKNHLKKENVSTEYVVVNKGKDTNFSSIITFRGERTILVYHTPWEYHLPTLAPVPWIYFTSAAPTHLPLHEQLLGYLERNPQTKMGFNPGTHQLNDGLKKLGPLIKKTEVFIVNKEEAAQLLELRAGDIPHMLVELKKEGPRYVVITDGQNGSFAFDGELFHQLESFPGKRVEATGAGDSYATALIAALMHGKNLAEAMAWGSMNAQSVVQFIGPQAGLLTKTEMEHRLKAHPNFYPHSLPIEKAIKKVRV